MIVLTRQNQTQFALNDELIETMEELPDTTVKLVDGRVYIVAESIAQVTDKIVEFRKRCFENVTLSNVSEVTDS